MTETEQQLPIISLTEFINTSGKHFLPHIQLKEALVSREYTRIKDRRRFAEARANQLRYSF